ncbi:MAG: CD225/dispanin family protein [Prevotellaceae bacterium]|nr:CD225/dispanin family protein [Candidatus Minthosoma equi]
MGNYFYLDASNAQHGPVPAEKLLENGVNANSMVWTEGMANWTPAGEVQELKSLFVAQVPPPVNPQPQPQPQQQAQPQSQLHSTSFNSTQQMNAQGGVPAKPDSNLVWGLLCTFLCCQIFGIISIVYACQVDGKWNRGDYSGAIEASKSAKNWAMWGAIGGVVASVILIIFYVIYFAVIGTAAFSGGF